MKKGIRILLSIAEVLMIASCFTFDQSSQNYGSELVYNGNGFTKQLQDQFRDSINDGTIFYNEKYDIQSWYIKNSLEKHKKGIWNIIIATDMNISKISEVSTGFFYWSFADTWALWYNVSQHSPYTIYIAIYNGEEQKSSNNVTTQKSEKGIGISSQLAQVIKSITETLDSTQDMAKYIQKYDGRKWSILSFAKFYNNKYPKAYGALDVGDVWLTYQESVTMGGQKYSQIIFV